MATPPSARTAVGFSRLPRPGHRPGVGTRARRRRGGRRSGGDGVVCGRSTAWSSAR